MASRISPESKVARSSPSSPCWCDRRRDQHDEGPGGPADLETAAAERGDEEAADDGGVEPAVRRHAGGDGDGHRERQGDDRDGQPRDGVGLQVARADSPRGAR